MKKIVVILSLLVAVSCANKKNHINVWDDRLMNSSIVNEFINRYFDHTELKHIKWFVMDISEKQDSLTILISPLIQKRDSLAKLPTGYITFGENNIFVKYPLNRLLPIDNNSLTIQKYKEVVKSIPEYVDTQNKKYPVWKILMKNNNYTIDSYVYLPSINPSTRLMPRNIPKKDYLYDDLHSLSVQI